jgi:hypothetical protein
MMTLSQLVNLNLQVDSVRSKICGLRNAFAPINDLHPEILAVIFQFLIDDRNRHASQRSRYRWISATHVCHYWRNAALSFPSLWSTIDYSSPNLALLCFERSGSSTSLDVRISPLSRSDETFPEWLPALIPRIRALEVKCGMQQFRELEKHLSDSPTPLLKYLDIWIRGPYYDPPKILPANLPSVERLILRGLIRAPPITRFGNLVHLKVRSDWDGTTMSEPLDFLESNPRLASIYFENVPFKDDTVAEGCVVSLDHLEIVTLIGQDSGVILRHLALTSTVRLRVVVALYSSQWEVHSLARLLPPSINNLRNLDRIQEIRFNGGRRSFGTVRVAAGRLKAESVCSYTYTHELFKPLSLTHVRVMWLQNIDLSDTMEQGPQLHLLPALEVLGLMQCHTPSRLFESLHPSGAGTLCPLLKELNFSDSARNDWDDIFGLARARKAERIPLQRALIRSTQTPKSSVIAQLKQSVENVDWRPRSRREVF